MARINFEERIFKHQGFQDLMIAVQSRHMAKGVVVELFQLAQEFWFPNRLPIPVDRFEAAGLPAILFAPGGLCEKRTDGIYVRGSKDAFAWLFEKSEAGKAGGKKSAEVRKQKFGTSQPGKTPKQRRSRTEAPSKQTSNDLEAPEASLLSSPSSSLSSLVHNSNSSSLVSSGGVQETPPAEANRRVWFSYRDAYKSRYGEEPVRNAQVNSCVADFVRRLGADEAPAIAAFYVSHNSSFYVQNTHSFRFATRDAETLRTQWAKGKAITQADVRRFEKSQQTLSLIESIDKEGV